MQKQSIAYYYAAYSLFTKSMLAERIKNSIIPPVIIFLLIIITIASCKQTPDKESFTEDAFDEDKVSIEIKEVKSIFYNMPSPVESSRLFRELNVGFDAGILNKPENQHLYNLSSKVAVNLGIYGADMSFCHIFGQSQEAINYLSVIYKLAQNLGLSGTFITRAETEAERLIYHPDSLYKIAGDLYIDVDRQLKDNKRSSSAALILTGGWIESLYIAGSFYDHENPRQNIEEQIIAQKFSLDHLATLLANHQNDKFAARYLHMIRNLKNRYDNVEIYFEKDDLNIDTSKKIIVSNKPEFSYTTGDIRGILDMVKIIRTDMVNL